MSLFPIFTLTFLNGFWLMIPLLLMRFLVPRLINRDSLSKLQYFPDTHGREKTALSVYFLTNTTILFSPLAMEIQTGHLLSFIGMVVYLLGCTFFLLSVISFSMPESFISEGIYRYSRNPMYIGYYLIFLGTGFLVNSILYILLVQVYQVAVHYLILSEERWCLEQFGKPYGLYMTQVPRYLFSIKK